MTQSCSTFAVKYFWQIVYMLFNVAKLVVVDPSMLYICSCHGQLHKHAILLQVCLFCHVVSASSSPRCLHIIVSAMLCFLPSLKPVNETCYVYMVAIISSGPFICIQYNTVMPCFAMLICCSMLISCSEHCYLMLFSAMSSNFTKSVNLLSFALLPCLFELVML